MSKWQFYDCIDGCGDIIYAPSPSICTKCKENRWKESVPLSRRNIFKFIVKYKTENYGISPTLKEIAIGCKISESAVGVALRELEKDKKVIRGKGQRSIRLVGERYYPPNNER